MNIIDIVLIAIGVFLFLLGFTRGLLRSIFGPLALILGSWAAWAYYQNTHQAFPSICIGLFGPMFISLILKITVGGWVKSLNPDKPLSAISQLSGALVTLIWGWVFVVLTVVFIDVFPGVVKPIKDLQSEINRSVIAKSTILPFKTFVLPANPPTSTSDDNLKALAHDPRLNTIINDPEIQQAAKTHDFATLLKNPKVMKLTSEMMNDPELMKKMMAVFSQMQKK